MRKNVCYFQVFLATISHFLSLPVASKKIDLVFFLAVFGILLLTKLLATVKIFMFY